MLRVTVVLSLICFALGAKDVGDDDRIVGGRTAMIKDFPYAISLQRREVHICGGSIITPTIIITAAHCILPLLKLPIRQVSIRAGSTIWSNGGQQIAVNKMVNHPKYDKDTKAFDIGFLRLAKPLEYDDVTVQPIEMATKIPGDGKECFICGWGLKKEKADLIPNMLQMAKVRSISKDKCSSDDFKYGADIKEGMICAQNPGIDACQGDSGGPYICNGKLTGVTSFGRGCAREDFPGIYTAIPAVAKWIARTIASLSPNATAVESDEE